MSDIDKNIGPAKPSNAFATMLPRWQRVTAVLGGTETMRSAGEALLPKHEQESSKAYEERLNRAVLTNFSDQILDAWTGLVFAEPLVVEDETPEALQTHFENVDLTGNNLNVFARNWFREGLAKAFAGVLVDFPRLQPRPDGQPRTVEDDLRDGVRPYFVKVPPESVLGGRVEIVNAVETLTHLRVSDYTNTPDSDDEFTENFEQVIKVFDLVDTEGVKSVLVRVFAWRKDGAKETWLVVDSYFMEIDAIPFVTFYADKQSLFCGKPPIQDVVELNIQHWQSCADQTAILTVARFPILALSGPTPDGGAITVGPNQWLHCPMPEGKYYYVEHSGAAISAGRSDIEPIEAPIAQYGAMFLKKRPGSETATARALDSAESTSALQDAAIRFCDTVDQALSLMAKWLRIDFAGGVRLELSKAAETNQQATLTALTAARASRDISRRAYVGELVRQGVLSDEYDVESDAIEIENETALSGETTTDLDPNNPDNLPDNNPGKTVNPPDNNPGRTVNPE